MFSFAIQTHAHYHGFNLWLAPELPPLAVPMAFYFYLFLRLGFCLLLSYLLNPSFYCWRFFGNCQGMAGRCHFMVSDKDR